MTQAGAPVILIVEDDMLFQSIYRTCLEQEGFRVEASADGEDALREMELILPDLVLLDLVLPRLSGYEVLSRMKETPALAGVPVIVLTNKGEPADIKRGMQLGAKDYLIKTTAHPKEVVWKIRQALAEKSGEPIHLRVALKERELDAPRLATTLGKTSTFRCPKCQTNLLLDLQPRPDQPGLFEARLVCPKCDK